MPKGALGIEDNHTREGFLFTIKLEKITKGEKKKKEERGGGGGGGGGAEKKIGGDFD